MSTFTLTYRTASMDTDALELEFDHAKVDWTEVLDRVRLHQFPTQPKVSPYEKYDRRRRPRRPR